MSDGHSGRGDQIRERLHRGIFDAVCARLGPPPPDVIENIEDVLGRAERDWRREEKPECQDEPVETQ